MSRIREKIEKLEFIENVLLVEKFGDNIYDFDLTDTFQTGVVDRLMKARELGIPYAVILKGIVAGPGWDKYGNGAWHPLRRGIITTYDIATPDNDREQEEKNIYAFVRGEQDKIISCKDGVPLLSQLGKRKR